MGQKRRQSDLTALLIDGRGLDGGDLVLAKTLADNVQPAGQRSIAEGPIPLPSPARPGGIVAVSDFSGLTSSAWALAKAEASAATVSLDRVMGRLPRLEHVKAHRPRFRSLGFHTMPDGLPGILGH